MHSKRRAFTASCFLVFVLFSIPAGVAGGKSTPLKVKTSSIADGEANVELDREILFVFSKNISNITVREANRKCFSLADAEGNPVTFEVILFDDQLERERRNDVILKPEGLEEGKEYVITVASGMTAKNGASLEGDLTYTFSTPGFEVSEGKGMSLYILIPGALVILGLLFILIRKRRD